MYLAIIGCILPCSISNGVVPVSAGLPAACAAVLPACGTVSAAFLVVARLASTCSQAWSLWVATLRTVSPSTAWLHDL